MYRTYKIGQRFSLLGLLLLLLIPVRLAAHAPDQSYLFFSIFEDSVKGRVEIPLSDLNKALNLGIAADKAETEQALAPHIEQIENYILNNVSVYPDGSNARLELSDYRLIESSFGQFLAMDFSIGGLTTIPSFIDINYSLIFDVDPNHRGLSVIENDWKSTLFNNESQVALTFSPSSREQRLDLSNRSLLSGLIGMIEIGVHHIAIGLDHVLFIIALLLPSVLKRKTDGWQPASSFGEALLNIVKIVTIFTVAHSITLSLAVLGAVEVSSRLVESVIALSIVLVAVDIIYPIFGRRIWWLVFVFGLFHGFGFASVLSEMGIHSNYTALSLLGFNIGVEVGQLIIVCIAFPVLYLLRDAAFYIRFGLPSGATVLIMIASYWFVERAFEVDLPAGQLANQFLSLFA